MRSGSVHFLRSCTLFIALAGTAPAAASCAADLERALRVSFGRRPVVDRDMGLPMNHRALASTAPTPEQQTALRLSPETLMIKSDLGLSAWSAEDFARWQSITPFIEDEYAALAEVNKITNMPAYCTPGLLPYLCQQLRLSHAAYLRALREHPMPADAGFNERSAIITARSRAATRAHDREDLLHFPWQTLRESADQMHRLHARNVLRTLAREALVRHLVIRQVDGQMILGDSIPERDRLIFASFPYLYPLIAFASRFPFETDPAHVIGDASEWLTLLRIPVFLPNAIRASVLVTLESAATLKKGLSIQVEREAEESKFPESAQRALSLRFERVAEDFRRLVRQNTPITVQWKASVNDEHALQVSGLGELDQILFFRFALDRLSAL